MKKKKYPVIVDSSFIPVYMTKTQYINRLKESLALSPAKDRVRYQKEIQNLIDGVEPGKHYEPRDR